MSNDSTFVPTNELEKPSLADRRLIRTRCMQGKNCRELPIYSAKQLPGTSVLVPQPHTCPSKISAQHDKIQSTKIYKGGQPYSHPCPERELGVVDAMISLHKLFRPPSPDIKLFPLAAEVFRHSKSCCLNVVILSKLVQLVTDLPSSLCLRLLQGPFSSQGLHRL